MKLFTQRVQIFPEIFILFDEMFFFEREFCTESKIRDAVFVKNVTTVNFSFIFCEIKAEVSFAKTVVSFPLAGKSSVVTFIFL